MIQTPLDMLQERLDSLPTDRHVGFRSHANSQGTTWRANWHIWENGERRTVALLLGKDIDGAIAAYIKERQAYKRIPVPVRDELGTILEVDEMMAAVYFQPPMAKTIYIRGEHRYVVDHSQDDKSGRPKHVSLARWVYEAYYAREVTGGHEIVQKVAGTDYTISNLQEVRKSKKGEDAA